MSHEHPLKTIVPDFIIDPRTREVTQTAVTPIVLMQYDHNSENLLFECPRHVDGHDMLLCDKIEVHFVNSMANGNVSSPGKYKVKHIEESPNSPDLVHFTWVVDRNATKHVGTLVFAVQFTCLEGTVIDYAWHTLPFSYISVDQGLVNELDDSYSAIYLDNLETKTEGRIEQITTATLDRAIKALEDSVINDIQALGSRIDTFTKLEEGSTTGDAELIDARVGVDGNVHTSAGSAIRTQISTLDRVKQPLYGSFVAVNIEVNEEEVYNVSSNTIQQQSGGRYIEYNVSNETMLLVSGFSWSSYSSFPLAAFYDSEGNVVAKIGHTASEAHSKKLCCVPFGAVKLIVNGNTWNIPSIEVFIPGNLESDVKTIQDKLFTQGFQMNGKKIVWIGTSVSFGQYADTSYPYEASKNLGFNLVNCSVPGLAIHTASNGAMLQYGSLALSKTEYKEQGWEIQDKPVEYIPGGDYNNHYRTYENVFCDENADADLYVFDIAPNNTNFNMTDWNAFDHSNWRYKDGSNFEDHRSTFLGALLFLMDKMYALNENARMVLILGSAFAYLEGKTAFQTIKDKWNIPVIDLWGNVNTSPKSAVKLKSNNGTDWHPSTFAHEVMGHMLTKELPSII